VGASGTGLLARHAVFYRAQNDQSHRRYLPFVGKLEALRTP
jgi:hypothetical protein